MGCRRGEAPRHLEGCADEGSSSIFTTEKCHCRSQRSATSRRAVALGAAPVAVEATPRMDIDAFRSQLFERLRTSLETKPRPAMRFDQIPLVQNSPHMMVGPFLWQLVLEGIIVPGLTNYYSHLSNAEHKAFPYFSVTPYGEAVILGRQGAVSPHDRTRYLKESEQRLPGAGIVATYLDEASRAFLAGLYLSAAVMLGVCAEALMDRVIERYAAGLSQRELAQFNAQIAKKKMSAAGRFAIIAKCLREDARISRELQAHVSGDFEMLNVLIKAHRDDVAHQRPQRIDKETVHGSLLLMLPLLALIAEIETCIA